MNATTLEPLSLNSEELAVLAELLESERTKLLVEIRHVAHRAFRMELRQRLNLVEILVDRCRSAAGPILMGPVPAEGCTEDTFL